MALGAILYPVLATGEAPPPPVEKAPLKVLGTRYCEVLAGGRKGLHIEFDVYNTIGLGDCPQAAWEKLNADKLKAEMGVDRIKLNGPRYWVLDHFESSHLLSTTVRTVGGMPMRIAGKLELPLTELLSMGKPYIIHTVRRDTIFVFTAGNPVYELIDPSGQVFDMQSYTLEKEPQNATSLALLGTRLPLPKGWAYRTRMLTGDLRVVALGGYAKVIQDDLGNTYQLSQQGAPTKP